MRIKGKNINLKIIVALTLILIFIIVFALFAQMLINKSVETEKRVYLNYHESSKINYDVYLKQNEFFSVNFLPKGYRYVASLSDYINTNFAYNFNFSEPISGEYNYYIRATLVTKEKDTSNVLWKENYILKEKTYEGLNNSSSISINENIAIEYDKYYQMINDFRSKYSVLVDSTLNVELILNTELSYGKFKNVIVDQKTLSLTIPLSDITYNITEYNGDINVSGDYNEITEEGRLNENLKHIGYVMWAIDGLVIIITLVFVYKYNYNKNVYASKLKKILKNYDSVIASVTKVPSLQGLTVICVTDFNELVNVQNELRIPISYAENIPGVESIFVIMHQREAWVYKLNALELNKETKEKDIFQI